MAQNTKNFWNPSGREIVTRSFVVGLTRFFFTRFVESFLLVFPFCRFELPGIRKVEFFVMIGYDNKDVGKSDILWKIFFYVGSETDLFLENIRFPLFSWKIMHYELFSLQKKKVSTKIKIFIINRNIINGITSLVLIECGIVRLTVIIMW